MYLMGYPIVYHINKAQHNHVSDGIPYSVSYKQNKAQHNHVSDGIPYSVSYKQSTTQPYIWWDTL